MTDRAVFVEGQLWTYEGAALPGSRVLIGRVDRPGGAGAPIVSIAVTEVPLPDRDTGEIAPRMIDHAPITGEALARCLREQVGTAPVPPDFEDGYGLWRQAFDRGEAGAFTVSVAELAILFRTMLAPRRGPTH